jgi:glycosyltransferase involved in cell wall biosynthesis
MELQGFLENPLFTINFMKVIYVIDTLEGYGAERSLVEIAVNMQDVTPVFVHLYNGDALRPMLEQHSIKVYSLDITSKYAYKEAIHLLSPIIEFERPDIIHSTLFRADMISRKIKNLFPNIILVGSFVSNSYGRRRYGQLSPLSQLKLFVTQLKDRQTSHNVDFFISNSETIKGTNSKALGVSPKKVKVIYRGRSLMESPLNTTNKILHLKKELGLVDKKVFLNVGRLQKGKGQADLIKAFSEAGKVNKEIVLLVAGEGPYRDELEKLIHNRDLHDRVKLLGYREDVRELLAVADYFIFPSYYEGLPGALIEAIIAGKPLIVSRIEENIECVPPGNALFFQPGNIKELKSQIETALQLPDWKERTRSSRTHAEKFFNIKDVSNQYETFYRKIVKERKI